MANAPARDHSQFYLPPTSIAISSVPLTIEQVNNLDLDTFVETIGPVFEHSPWIAERTWPQRPFDDREALHGALVQTVEEATEDERVDLILAHPDLVGRAARAGTLAPASAREQAGAGLEGLSATEIALFDRFNGAYRERFGFPFVICAREHKKETILAAFPERLENSPREEIETALAEIAKIAWFRLIDVVEDENEDDDDVGDYDP